jgi:peptidoglycan lytic transglycosylase
METRSIRTMRKDKTSPVVATLTLLVALLLHPLVGDAATAVRKPTPAVQRGHASWYGRTHDGRRTASGEIFDMRQLTAAHPSLPLGTRVLVTNLNNGRSVEVRVNDRGPTIRGRIIDLSYAAARKLDAVGEGVVPVTLRVVSKPEQIAARRSSTPPARDLS